MIQCSGINATLSPQSFVIRAILTIHLSIVFFILLSKSKSVIIDDSRLNVISHSENMKSPLSWRTPQCLEIYSTIINEEEKSC